MGTLGPSTKIIFMTIKFRDWIIVVEMLSSSREELDIDLCKIVGIFISQKPKNAVNSK